MNPDIQNQSILEILRKRGFLSGTSMRTVLGFMTKWGITAYHAVVETHVVDEARLADILSEEYRFNRIVHLRSLAIDKDALKYLTYERAMAWEALPFRFGSDESLHVLIADPTNHEMIEYLKGNSDKTVVFFVAERSEIEVATQKNYPLTMQLPQTMTTCNTKSEH